MENARILTFSTDMTLAREMPFLKRYRAAFAYTAKEAMEECTKEIPQVMIYDMSSRDPFRLVLLKAIRDKWPDLPIIILAHDGQLQVPLKHLGSGPNYLVPKHAERKNIGPLIQEAVHRSLEQRRELIPAA